jgi:hypothetical protein
MSGIIYNRAKCLICGDVIESKSLHDFRQCSCLNLSVDGGKHYIKRSARYPERVEEMSQTCNNDDCYDCLRNCVHKNKPIS